MSIRADSYSSVDEVTAFIRRLLDGVPGFGGSTDPQLSDIEKIIDRTSGVLNVALAGAGFSAKSIIANSTAKLACDDWVTFRAAQNVEMTQVGSGFNEMENKRASSFAAIIKDAQNFVSLNARGWTQMGVPLTHPLSEGLAFTAIDAIGYRDDPTDTSIAQPLFTRRQFDNQFQTLYGPDDERDDNK